MSETEPQSPSPPPPARPIEPTRSADALALELAANRARVLDRIRSACHTAQRDPGSVRLLAVSKTFGPEAVMAMAASGQKAFAENYLQEALDKIAACRAAGLDALDWHFIGPIQSNKTRPIAEHFGWVHSVDREKIARRLSEQRPAGLGPLNVCLQVNVSGEDAKSGCQPEEALALAQSIAQLPGLRLRGLMAIPEPTQDTALQRQRFGTLSALSREIGAALATPLDTLSMGMSDDLESAIAEGSTMVRVGTALFGRRHNPAQPMIRPLP